MTVESILEQLKKKQITPDEARKRLAELKNIAENASQSKNNVFDKNAIAIVGMSGRYPGAKDIYEYWDLLEEGKEGIREIPKSRWDMSKYYDPEKGKEGKIYCKWLGMVDDANCFDPMFFEIPPSEAESMEPLHRVFIEEGYKAFEDAGYTRQRLSNVKCGVYAGMITGEYEKLSQKYGNDNTTITGSSNAIGAARLSYYFNLKGPAVSVDTACSSAMVCTHMAVQALQRGEIDMALVGGSSLYLSAGAYVAMCSAGMLSPEGKCKTFDNDADGFVPADGAGALVLKRLEDAQRDNDNIHGVIIASGMNQDGKTNGITAPNLGSQIELIRDVYSKYKIEPESISYAELHGTGTKLGDPIELEALASAYSEKTNKKNYCGIGSVKSNLGHTSAASGMASIQKVLLCMEHKKMVPTLNVKKPNEHFDFKNSPFYINTSLHKWDDNNQPRRAGVSSFGYSGTNTHVVLQEYVYPDNSEADENYFSSDNLGIFVLSAKNHEQLTQYAEKMLKFLNSEDVNFTNLLFTLQLGREEMKERLAIAAENKGDLAKKLQQFIDSGSDNTTIFSGSISGGKKNYKLLAKSLSKNNSAAPEDYKNPLTLAKEWANGKKVEWKKLYNSSCKARRISLPTIPLAREVFWFEKKTNGDNYHLNLNNVCEIKHPLVHQNVSDFSAQKFVSTFSGDEFFLNEHQLNGVKILPGSAVIEMARTAAELSSGLKVSSIGDIVWLRAVKIADNNTKVFVELYPEMKSAKFGVYVSHGDGEKTLCAEGKVNFSDKNDSVDVPTIDLQGVKLRCEHIVDKKDLYPSSSEGIQYGNHFKVISSMCFNNSEVLSVLEHRDVSGEYKEELDKYVLHPCILDGALQTVSPLMNNSDGKVYLPFSVGSLKIFSKLTGKMFVHTEKLISSQSDNSVYFNIIISDENGNVLAKVNKFSLKPMNNIAVLKAKTSANSIDNVFLKTVYEKKNITSGVLSNDDIVVFDTNRYLFDKLKEKNSNVIFVEFGKKFEKKSDNEFEININNAQCVAEIINYLIKENACSCSKIVYASHMNNDFDNRLNYSAYKLLSLSKALINMNLHREIRLVHLFDTDMLKHLPEYSALGAFFKTLNIENENFLFKNVGFSFTKASADEISDALLGELNCAPKDFEVVYKNNQRFVCKVNEIENVNIPDSSNVLKDNGVYIITGGTGGVGLIFAKYLSKAEGRKVILTGRKPYDDRLKKHLQDIFGNKSNVVYVQADVSDKNQVKELVNKVRNKFRRICGVIHCAGVNHDGLIRNKSERDFESVITPKVYGVRYLDDALSDEKLDFFVMCSSTSAVLGNFGQCDYCYANSYMDAYAKYRSNLVKSGERFGKTVSINWPYWKNGGMRINEQRENLMKNSLGMYPLDDNDGIDALLYSITSSESRVICVKGNRDKIIDTFCSEHIAENKIIKAKTQGAVPEGNLKEKTEEYLKQVFSEIMKIKVEKIDSSESFDTFGIDSIIIMSLTKRLEEDLGELPKTLFFEYQNIDELSDYFVENQGAVISEFFAKDGSKEVNDAVLSDEIYDDEKISGSRFWNNIENSNSSQVCDDIAIIGISGKYPMADNLGEFWENLKNAKDCISEVPSDRWDNNKIFDSKKGVPAKTYGKWGGFINDVDKFDPLFFNISPGEADFLDPQARLFLEAVWHTMEDAGYTRAALGKSKVGVFVGVMYSMYELFEGELKNTRVPVASSFSAIANRVSYFMNFTGPSIAVDTMCSSSLTALHLGCESIKNGMCECAFVGGVNLTVHPNKYLLLSQGHFLSTDGRCKAFGKDGDGYVPGEGVGAVMLKLLSKAVEDKDNIYAVIKGSSINACGKTNGFTVPSPKIQAQLIKEALKRADVKAESISCIEAHGTGTSLGDPIEIQGLSSAFAETTQAKQFCSIGSVKSNIGHLESAAGIAAVTKVALELKNHKLVPSLHSEDLNPYIHFENTPFYVQHKYEEWEKLPDNDDNDDDKLYPRRAGISAFGAGGSNAHAILEEYDNSDDVQFDDSGDKIYVFSAKSNVNLRAYLENFVKFLNGSYNYHIETYHNDVGGNDDILMSKAKVIKNLLSEVVKIDVKALDIYVPVKEYITDIYIFSEFSQSVCSRFKLGNNQALIDTFDTVYDIAKKVMDCDGESTSDSCINLSETSVAFTLQTGREAMEERLAVKAQGLNELADKITKYLNGLNTVGVYSANILDVKDDDSKFARLQQDKQNLDEDIKHKNLDKIAALWVQGADVNWKELYGNEMPQKASLPGYCFTKEHCWVLSLEEMSERGNSAAVDRLHPMLHRNTSDIYELKFSSVFNGKEFFLKDHTINGTNILPGVAYLEVAMAAAKQIFHTDDEERVFLKNIIWIKPFAVGQEAKELNIKFSPSKSGEFGFEIYSNDGSGAKVSHCQGVLAKENNADSPVVYIERLKHNCTQFISGEDCYNDFEKIGIKYGKSFRSIKSILRGNGQELVSISAPQEVLGDFDLYQLHPSILDATLQANIGFAKSSSINLPFALNEVRFIKKCSEEMYALVTEEKQSNGTSLNVDLFDGDGNVCVQLKNVVFRQFDLHAAVNSTAKMLYKPVWHAKNVTADVYNAPDKRIVIICDADNNKLSEIRENVGDADVTSVNLEAADISTKYTEYAVSIFNTVRQIIKTGSQKKTLVQIYFNNRGENCLLEGLSGLAKTVSNENPNIMCQLIQSDSECSASEICSLLNENAKDSNERNICYKDSKRLVQKLEEYNAEYDSADSKLWKDNGVYLITGGAGGLGFIAAENIAENAKNVNLILSGRREINSDISENIKKLQALGADVEYISADVSNKESTENLINRVMNRYHKLNGIIHCAGVIRDGYIAKKSEENFRTVLAPKVYGVYNLDRAAKDISLDNFIIYSSLASVIGNPGQSDYATANGFVDSFASYRNELAKTGARSGRTISINWSLWQDGGMQIGADMENAVKNSSGLTPISEESGMWMLNRAVESNLPQLIAVEGVTDRVRKFLTPSEANSVESNTNKTDIKIDDSRLKQISSKLIIKLKEILASEIRLDVSRIDERIPLENYGIDSVMIIHLTNELENYYGTLPKTLFFDNQSIKELSQYLCKNYYEQTVNILGISNADLGKNDDIAQKNVNAENSDQNAESFWLRGKELNSNSASLNRESGPLDIAIVGVAGQYPQADDLKQYWDNLANGKDCVTEIPKDRWDCSKYYDPDKRKQGKTYAKWGGFINNPDCFDPMFFNISPAEAEIMDPQERLFLECVYHAIEDAGYTKNNLSTEGIAGLSNNVGVFVGVMYEEYQLYGAQAQVKGHNISLNGNAASIANRISYICGFHGPSVALDTMCSSSLVSVHLACNSIVNGECDAAIAGGVNLSIHPNKYLTLSRGKFASSVGKCQTFGKDGDGYTPGEGVGAIVLKSRQKAIEDGDHIYGIIRGSSVNHGGKTNGYTVPNPHAQESVISRAIKQSGVNPRAISYIEAHGTGTSLGDPIEITALSRAFGKYTNDKHFCKIGSVKSNIGHCESAAGIAGITKILLQMKYKKLVPSLHSAQLNPNIDFENSPFVVEHEYEDWKRPIVNENGTEKQYPLIAGVSAFGAGGTNAHIIIEEYSDDFVSDKTDSNSEQIILLSARKEKQLNQMVDNLAKWLSSYEAENVSLQSIAYTLQVGRESLDERLAFVVGSRDELKDALEKYKHGSGSFYRATVKDSSAVIDLDDEDMQAVVKKWYDSGKYSKIAKLWVDGSQINWSSFYGENKPQRVSLPTYPFAEERYWISKEAIDLDTMVDSNKLSYIHPLIHKNVSDFFEQKYVSEFDGSESVFADHIVNNKKTLPAVCYLEMVRAAFAEAMNIGEQDCPFEFKDVAWLNPLTVNGGQQKVYTVLTAVNDSAAKFEIFENADENKLLHSRGTISKQSGEDNPICKITEITEKCNAQRIEGSSIYDLFDKVGIKYGESQRGIKYILCGGKNELLARIEISESLYNEKSQYTLNPCIMDSALQSVIGFSVYNEDKSSSLKLPFMIDRVKVYGKCPKEVWAYVTASENSDKVSVRLCDDNGTEYVEMFGVYYRTFSGSDEHEAHPELQTDNHSVVEAHGQQTDDDNSERLYGLTLNLLKDIFSKVLKFPKEELEEDVLFEKYGIDSILIMNLNDYLEEKFGNISKTLLFEYQNLKDLTWYFIDNYRDKVCELTNENSADTKLSAPIQKESESKSLRVMLNDSNEICDDEIAVIGLSGKYAKADSIEEYWNNIKNGVDCISEIPQSRWDYKKYFNPDKDNQGTTYTKWGGFLNNVDGFEPLFFNISPRDAVIMDPQERLFMECAYSTLEDAGYTRKELGYAPGSEVRRNVGVYVGVMNEEYHLYAAQEQNKGNIKVLSGNISQVANRFSYFCDFHGPSLSLDTMCSSSLVAIHLACQAIKNGDCEMAIAGGVNVMIHPNKYFVLASGKFASTNGKCMSFGEGGDGYVPGEGVGAVLLKSKKQAVADGDHIYGIIKGTAVNHGGKTNGYTVPNPIAQEEVIRSAMSNAKVTPEMVSYVEAHGTGTALGDPIEINSINKAYADSKLSGHSCAIGSVKSNIGHCESASGIAALTKVLMQMKYKKIAPSLHSKSLNPNIDFDRTPFYVPQKLEDWKSPEIIENGIEKKCPRIAGISSFGAGGTNAHIIVEEYVPDYQSENSYDSFENAIALSAGTKEQLSKIAENLIDYLESSRDCNFDSVAYTLQVGREPMEERCAFVANSNQELIKKLKSYVEGDFGKDIFVGTVYSAKKLDGEERAKLDKAVNEHNAAEICRLWIQGVAIDWKSLYSPEKPHKISLPTYPFANERYFIDITDDNGTDGASVISPVLHYNRSSLYEQKFESVFTGNEYYLSQHQINNQRILPGSVTLEMARAAGSVSLEHQVFIMRDVVWTNQISVENGNRSVFVELDSDDECVNYRVFTQNGEEKQICSEGGISYDDINDYEISDEKLSVDEITADLDKEITSDICYNAMQSAGLINGGSFRVIDKILYNNTQAVSYMKLVDKALNDKDEYVLHPALINGAFQSVVALLSNKNTQKDTVFLPFALDEIRIFANVNDDCIAYITEIPSDNENIYKCDIVITLPDGTLLAQIDGFTLKSFKIEHTEDLQNSKSQNQDDGKLNFYTSVWNEKELSQANSDAADNNTILLFDDSGVLYKKLGSMNNLRVIHIASGESFRRINDNSYNVGNSQEDYINLFKDILDSKISVNRMIVYKSASDYQDDRESLAHIDMLYNISQSLMSLKYSKEVKLLWVFENLHDDSMAEYYAAGGFAKSLYMENLRYNYKVIGIDQISENLVDVVLSEFETAFDDREIRYVNSKRYVRELAVADVTEKSDGCKIVSGGTYIITGGVGGLGSIFAEHLSKISDINIVLTGRRAQDSPDISEVIDRLKSVNPNITYIRADVSKRDDVENLYKQVKEKFGAINGIIHSAGVTKDSFVLKKKSEEAKCVFASKISGTKYLDEIFKDEKLDFFVLFSSIAGVFGNIGQSDYSVANSFMDYFSVYRNKLTEAGQRFGKTLSVDWPLWLDGKMQVDAQTQKMMRDESGLSPITNEEGIFAFDSGLKADYSQFIVLKQVDCK